LFFFQLLKLLLTVSFIKELRRDWVWKDYQPGWKQKLSERYNNEKRKGNELDQIHANFSQPWLLVVRDVWVFSERGGGLAAYEKLAVFPKQLKTVNRMNDAVVDGMFDFYEVSFHYPTECREVF